MENIDRTRFEPEVLSFTDGPMVTRLREMGIQTHLIPTLKPFDVSVWGKVRVLMQERGIEMVHAHGTRACSNTLHAARKLGIPLAYTVHGWSFHPGQSPLVRRLRTMGEKYLTRKSTLNIAVSASNRQSGVEALKGFDAVVVSNGINRDKFNPGNQFADVRAELGIPSDAILVLFVARMTSHKQPLTLVEAFAKVTAENERLHLLMVGDGDEKEAAVALASQLGQAGRIHFQPFRQDVPAVLHAADIFVLPSLWEGLPIGLLEAMAMGKAVIVTDVDGTRELITDGENGLMSVAGDPVSLAEAIRRMAADEAMRLSFGKKVLQKIHDEYNASTMTRKIEDLYLSLYNGRTKS